MRRPIYILLFASVFAWAGGKAEARPPELRELVDAPYPAGCSEYRFLLWNFYRAELWSDAKALPGDAFGLALTYRTDFTREELVKSSVEEMSRISGRPEQAFAEASAELRQAFRDVAKGDRITAWRAGPNKLQFYLNGQETGSLTRGALSRTSLLAAALAFGGLPLYVHVPRFYAEQMALGLPALGAVLLAARAFDSVQDPVIGWLADRWRGWREIWAVAGMTLLASGFLILFAPPDWGAPLPRLAIGLLAAFTGFSALQIAIYDHGLALAGNARGAHTRVALWREAGGLGGICLAAMAPAVLATVMGPAGAFLGFALLFLAVAAAASLVMAGHWRASGSIHAGPGSFRRALATPGILPILGFGFVNALPTAVTSTLFLFFVSHVLEAEDHAGPLLLLFFAAAASAAPGWARLADRFGRRITLASAMSLSILAFAWAFLLGQGDVAPFYVVAIASGAALGADMTLAPAMLAARIEDDGGRVFALWTFLQKSALALAAGIALPAVALAGFVPAEPVTEQGREALSVAYALVPCLLKLIAIGALGFLPSGKETILAET